MVCRGELKRFSKILFSCRRRGPPAMGKRHCYGDGGVGRVAIVRRGQEFPMT